MKGIVVDCVTGEIREADDGLPPPPEPAPLWEYELADEVTIAPDLPLLTIKSTIHKLPRELSPSEEADLERKTGMKIKGKRKA